MKITKKVSAAVLAAMMAATMMAGTSSAYTTAVVPTISAGLAVSEIDKASASTLLPTCYKGTYYNASTATTVKLDWNKVSGAEGYQVYKLNPETGKYALAKTVTGGDTTVCTVTGLASGSNHSFKLRAYKTVNGTKVYSAFSAPFTAYTAPAKVVHKTTFNAGSGYRVFTWNAVTGADSYEVYSYTGGKWTKIATTTSLGYSTNAASGKFKVRAVRELDVWHFVGAFSDTITL